MSDNLDDQIRGITNNLAEQEASLKTAMGRVGENPQNYAAGHAVLVEIQKTRALLLIARVTSEGRGLLSGLL